MISLPRLKLILAVTTLAGALAAPASAAAALTITAPSGSTNGKTATIVGAGALPTPDVTVTLSPGGATLTATPTATGTWQVTSGALADGTYTATATQGADTSPSVTFTIDTIAPALTMKDVKQASSTDAKPAIRVDPGVAPGDGAVTVEVRNAAGTVVASGTATATAGDNGLLRFVPAKKLDPGVYSALATQKDAAGNTTQTAPVTFTVESPAAPIANFTVSPANPVAGDSVVLTSTSSDPNTGQTATLKETWDFNHDGLFTDATGHVVSISTLPQGSFAISLQVEDVDKQITKVTKIVTVSPRTQPPAPPAPPASTATPAPASAPAPALAATPPAPTTMAISLPPSLSPFPVVRLVAELTGRGIRLRTLTVSAPNGARVGVTCRGKGCPTKVHALRATTGVALRVRQLERRKLRAGVVITILVTSPGRIGKYTRFVVQRAGAPKRTDRCLAVNGRSPIACPGR